MNNITKEVYASLNSTIKRYMKSKNKNMYAVANKLGISEGILYKRLNFEDTQRHVNISMLIDIVRITSDISPLRTLANQFNYSLNKNTGDTNEDIKKLAKEMLDSAAEAMVRICKDYGDNQSKIQALEEVIKIAKLLKQRILND